MESLSGVLDAFLDISSSTRACGVDASEGSTKAINLVLASSMQEPHSRFCFSASVGDSESHPLVSVEGSDVFHQATCSAW